VRSAGRPPSRACGPGIVRWCCLSVGSPRLGPCVAGASKVVAVDALRGNPSQGRQFLPHVMKTDQELGGGLAGVEMANDHGIGIFPAGAPRGACLGVDRCLQALAVKEPSSASSTTKGFYCWPPPVVILLLHVGKGSAADWAAPYRAPHPEGIPAGAMTPCAAAQ